ncbi:MAG: thiamine diphosphokinase [Ruminococcus sp.]|uniref:thiamine diphosphokinase n=1 Tax=Ruminococcus sp. TaxID=41978 RepID=UPI0025FADB8F|nr:thiamine diphosphokinase [Ruminococcus sp.]MBR0530929.1 thiamine diphosphokinase [Ruminococcus sp.]
MIERCVIFAGGDAVRAENVSAEVINGAFVICADKGLALAETLGIKADLVLGDFDSLNYKPEGENVKVYPVEKDDTDLMLAVRTALGMGYREFFIYGACGGRLDHMIGNIACLAMIADNGGRGVIIGDDDIVSIYDSGCHKIPYKEGFSLSLFAYSAEVKGLTIRGTKYLAENVTLTDAVTLGVSNEITADFAEVEFTDGRLLAIQSRVR